MTNLRDWHGPITQADADTDELPLFAAPKSRPKRRKVTASVITCRVCATAEAVDVHANAALLCRACRSDLPATMIVLENRQAQLVAKANAIRDALATRVAAAPEDIQARYEAVQHAWATLEPWHVLRRVEATIAQGGPLAALLLAERQAQVDEAQVIERLAVVWAALNEVQYAISLEGKE